MDNKNENRSLFLYTALIFIAAILIIVISFFCQINLEKNHNEYTGENPANGIAEKTAQLSEENMILLETTKNLNQQNTQLLDRNKELTDKIAVLEKNQGSNEELYRIFNLIKNKDKEAAKSLFEALDASEFSGEKLAFYEYLKKELKL